MSRLICILIAVCIATPSAILAQGVSKKEFKRWLDQEVVWIIGKDEKKDAKRIKTDQERAAFIEEFWKPRDPTPGTQKNEYKEIHYGRLKFASDEFKEEGPGWRSDRGRVWIIHGEPRSRDRLQREERWHYSSNPYAEYYKGAITLIFRQGATAFQNRLLSDSRTAQNRNVPGAGGTGLQDTSRIVESIGASSKFRLTVAGPTSSVTSTATSADLDTDLGETDRYIADILRSPGDAIADSRRDRGRRRQALSEARQIIDSNVSFEAMEISVETIDFRTEEGVRLYLTLHVPADQLAFQAVSDQGDGKKKKKKKKKGRAEAPKQAKLDVLCEITDKSSSFKVDSFDETLFALEGQDLFYANQFTIPEGDHQLYCLARDSNAKRMGHKTIDIDRAKVEGDKIATSGILLTQSARQVTLGGGPDPLIYQGVRLSVPVARHFRTGKRTVLYFQVYNAAKPSGDLKRLVYDYKIVQGSTTVSSMRLRKLQSDDVEKGTLSFGENLDISSLAAGDYTLKLRIASLGTRQRLTHELDFKVVP